MIEIIGTAILFIITSISLAFFTDIHVVLKITIPLVYLAVSLMAYLTGYKKGIIDIRTGLKDMIDDDVAELKAELERISQGVDSGLL